MKVLRIELLILVGLLVLAILRPLPKASFKNSEIIKAKISHLALTDDDIAIRIEGDNNNYYINRGTERGLDFGALEKSLLDQEVELFYIKHFTPIDPKQKSRHISRIQLGESIVYDEISQK